MLRDVRWWDRYVGGSFWPTFGSVENYFPETRILKTIKLLHRNQKKKKYLYALLLVFEVLFFLSHFWKENRSFNLSEGLHLNQNFDIGKFKTLIQSEAILYSGVRCMGNDWTPNSFYVLVVVVLVNWFSDISFFLWIG